MNKNKKQKFIDEIEALNAGTLPWDVDIERTQRIFLGLDSEKMEFNEKTLADMLKTIAADNHCLSCEHTALQAVANALLGQDDHFSLVLKHNKRGKFVSPYEYEIKASRNESILRSIAHYEKKGWKTEAAIAKLQESFGLSRAAIYSAIKDAEKDLEIFSKLGNENFKNPRHSKNHDDVS